MSGVCSTVIVVYLYASLPGATTSSRRTVKSTCGGAPWCTCSHAAPNRTPGEDELLFHEQGAAACEKAGVVGTRGNVHRLEGTACKGGN